MVGLWKGTLGLLPLLLSGTVLYANVIGTPHVDFRQTFTLGPSGRVTHTKSRTETSAFRLGSRRGAGGSDEAFHRSPPPGRRPDHRGAFVRRADHPHRYTPGRMPASGQRGVPHHGTPHRQSRPVKLVTAASISVASPVPCKASAVNGGIHADKAVGQGGSIDRQRQAGSRFPAN